MADIEGLRKLIEDTSDARGHSPFFVGRREELGLIDRIVATEKARREDGKTNGINVFSGPPGSGKTSLLQIAAKKLGEEGNPLTAPLAIHTTPGALKNERALLDLCAESAFNFAQKHETSTRLSEGAVRALLNYFTNGQADASMRDIKNTALSLRPVVLLMVDEAQTSTEDNADVYMALNQGHFPIPAAAVFAGLSTTDTALERAGISRLGADRHVRLPLLNPQDCRQAMDQLLDRYGIETESRGEWLDFAERQSDLFPIHLHSILLATAQTAIGNEGGKLAGSGLLEAGRLAAEKRNAYYESRCRNLSPVERWLAAAVVSRVEGREAKLPFVVDSVLSDESNLRNEEVEYLARTLDREQFAEELVRRGMLQRYEGEVYEAPIPSFSTWLAEGYGHFLMQGHNRQ